jgi:bifunctional non-homologous end joining protein LigD
MLWDRGTWTPETDDVEAAMKKGDLKFTLDGYKLKGSWVLVRTKGRYAGGSEGGDPWLLIKHRDDWSGPIDIAEFAPLSVKSKGDFADILSQDDPDVWRSNRPAKGGETGAMFERIVKRALELRSRPATVSARATPPQPAAAAKSAARPRTAATTAKTAASATRGKKR